MFKFFYLFPPVTVTNQLILFLSSAFWGPPPPTQYGRHIWKPPYLAIRPARVSARHAVLATTRSCNNLDNISHVLVLFFFYFWCFHHTWARVLIAVSRLIRWSLACIAAIFCLLSLGPWTLLSSTAAWCAAGSPWSPCIPLTMNWNRVTESCIGERPNAKTVLSDWDCLIQ